VLNNAFELAAATLDGSTLGGERGRSGGRGQALCGEFGMRLPGSGETSQYRAPCSAHNSPLQLSVTTANHHTDGGRTTTSVPQNAANDGAGRGGCVEGD